MMDTEIPSTTVPSAGTVTGHRGLLIFHIGMKICAIFSYMCLFWILGKFVLAFVSTTICLAVDFWFTKNVSGRLLAGMRWWSFVKEDGTSEWVFETLPQEQLSNLNQTEVQLFWQSMYAFAGFWLISSVYNLVTLDADNFVLCVIGATFATSNVLGYRKCAKAKNNISALAAVKLLAKF